MTDVIGGVRVDGSELLIAGAATPNRDSSTPINVYTGETISVSVLVYDTDGTTPIDLDGIDLAVAIEDERCQHIATVDSDDITIAGSDSNLVEFTLPAAVTSKPRLAGYAIRVASGAKYVYARGTIYVQHAPAAVE
ncbi:hypothetical protein Enr13x_42440 [Stieleria neptunia]|uniref:BppU N-terminal domain-containing protein n=1 Tax=Stieleria neptunia TaxID=2527979 RepID=A0A518HU73_9BACT|nr:hypothetical protein [Stieleria neptunia]QDV44379.1 hypothetical protein Enr13x_42440 [Stieleria neptunia]